MLRLQEVLFTLSDRFVIGPINLEIPRGQHVAIIGESGCGKTTLLKMIYGLFDINSGSIQWNNQEVTGPEDHLIPGMPYMKYLSQDFDLMPFTSVEENINKYLSRLEPVLSKSRTDELMEVVEMTAFAKAHVKTLSGGQKQRVALAQTLAKEPELLLLDEPFSHIDNFRKNKLRRRLFTYLKAQKITCLVATHDSTDILAYTDTTVVMKEGKVVIHKETQALYKRPPSYYVGSLFGDINELPKQWFFDTALPEEKIIRYPDQLVITKKGVRAVVIASYFMGSFFLIKATVEDTVVLFRSDVTRMPGEHVFLGILDQ